MMQCVIIKYRFHSFDFRSGVNYNDSLREKISTEKASHMRGKNMIGNKNIATSKWCAKANESAPKGLDDKSIDNHIKVTNDKI